MEEDGSINRCYFEWNIPIPNISSKAEDEGLYTQGEIPFLSYSCYLGCTFGNITLYVEFKESDLDRKRFTCFSGFKKANGKVVSVSSVEVDPRQFKDEVQVDLWNLHDYPELKSSETVTITCRLEEATPHPEKVKVSKSLKVMELNTLSSNLEALFINKRKCDVIVKVCGKEFEAHKAILMARSPVFDAMFEHDLSEEKTGIVAVPDCDADSFSDFMHYLYTGKFERVSSKNAHHLYVTSDKYDVQELKTYCVDYLLQNLTLENVFDVLHLADRYSDEELMSAVQMFFNKNVNKIISNPDWVTLMKESSLLANKLLKDMLSHFEITDLEVISYG